MNREEQLERYNEAYEWIKRYDSYTGDKRKFAYRRLRNEAMFFIPRMDHFGKLLGLPTSKEVFGY